MDYRELLDFYKGKRVLVTGHTGFKGSWMCRVLHMAGAQVCGYSLVPPTNPSLYELAGIDKTVTSIVGDVRDRASLSLAFAQFQPEIVIHMAAQPIVRESYKDPVYTFETNIMGTVNICECVRQCGSVKSFVNVTTDKVYDNKEREDEGYREDEPLDGYDPYSNSKSCSELVTHSYARSFLIEYGIAVSTARAGNVIGGGDFATDRIIPDCVRAALSGNTMVIRNPHSTRPYQHVLEPVFAYLMIAKAQYENPKLAGWYNVGPDDCDCVTTGELVMMFSSMWEGLNIEIKSDNGPHEAGFLKLDCGKLKNTFAWAPKWHIKEAVAKTVEFSKLLVDCQQIIGSTDDKVSCQNGCQASESLTQKLCECMDKQIREYANV